MIKIVDTIGRKLDLMFRKNSEETKALSQKLKLKGFSDLLNYAVMPTDDLIMNKDGGLISFFVYKGKDVQSSTDDELDGLRNRFNHAFRLTEEGWMIEFNLVRIPSTDYPSDIFPDRVSSLIDAERNASYSEEGTHYDTINYLTISRSPFEEMSKAVKRFAFDQEEGEVEKEDTLDDYIIKYEKALGGIIDILSSSLDIERLTGDSVMRFLHYCISGKKENIKVPQIAMFMDAYLANNDFVGGMEPKIGDKYIKVLDFQDFPIETFPTILDDLNTLPIEYRWSTRFIPLDIDRAKSYMRAHLKHWNQKAKGVMGLIRESIGVENGRMDRDALIMAEQTEQAITDNQSGLIRYGFMTKTIILMHENKMQLEENANFIRKILNNKGYMIRYESVNAVDSYLGSIPGHGYYNLRRPLMDSLTLSNTAPISSVYQGSEHCPCEYYGEEKSALFYSKTDGSTPYRFNLHVGDIGHSMIIGPTGSGKTTVLGLIIAQHRKYKDSQIFVLDKDNSNMRLIKSLTGSYFNIGSEKTEVSFAPFQYIDDVEEFDWCCLFIEDMCSLQGVKLTGDKKELIRHTLETFKGTDAKFRKLSNFVNQMQDPELRSALKVYVSGNTVGKMLNSAEDGMEVSSITGFELGWLLSQKEELYIPVINYLFRKFERLFQKRKPTLLILEEAWMYIDNEIIRNKLKDWLKTLRKFNVSVIFTSQALNDVGESQISSVLAESCLTKIYLANLQAKSKSKAVYEMFGLNERQIELISTMEYKRDYYVTSPEGNRVIDLGLGPVTLSFVGISKEEDQKEFDKLYDPNDENWISKWLEYKKLDKFAKTLVDRKAI